MRSPSPRGAAAWLALALLAACGGRESLFGGRLDDEGASGRGANVGGSGGKSTGKGGRTSGGDTSVGGTVVTGGGGFEVGGMGSGVGATSGFGNVGGFATGGTAGAASGGFGQGGSSEGGALSVGGFGAGSAGVGGLASGGSAAGLGGFSAGGSGTAGSGGNGGSSAGSGGGAGGPVLGGACTPNGALACHGAAQRLRLLCESGTWHSNGTCADSENCNRNTGVCSPIVPECYGSAPGAQYCAGDVLMACGQDLVDSSPVEACEGRCVETALEAFCVSPSCGDGRIQDLEECDDENFDDGDSCTNNCRDAVCGDGSLFDDREACDDGNLASGDECSVLCGWEPVAVAAGWYHTCAFGVTGRIQCWGNGAAGQLGLGDSSSRGDNGNEMGVRLPIADMGTDQTVLRLAAAFQTSCAILGGGELKCWGYNASGGLGLGDTASRGSQAAQMGDQLPVIPLGAEVASVAIGQAHTCALLGDGRVKCWGSNAFGQLGVGTTDSRGDVPNEIQNLPVVDLGSGSAAQAITAGTAHTCALLSDGDVKCWGNNLNGQLGLGDTATRGDAPGEMGDALPRVDLGGLAANFVGAGDTHNCALLEDGSVRCWGRNIYGALGLGSTDTRGDGPNEMGQNLLPVDLGAGKAALELAVGTYYNCARLNDSSVKCWGYNGAGALGLGDTANRGDGAGEMGDSLPAVNLGTARHATQLTVGMAHACALLDNRTIKCWGYNVYGQLGLGDTTARGDSAGEMGDLLEPTFVSF
jgi:cysteine-rich repeat protein